MSGGPETTGREGASYRSETGGPDVFISYASVDRDQVLRIASCLETAGVRVWLDRHRIEGGARWDEEIVRAVRDCKVLVLICSEASMRSRNVKQEIQLAWTYKRPYLPLLLDDSITGVFPEQVQYFLEGWQWVEVKDRAPEAWLPAVSAALARHGVTCRHSEASTSAQPAAVAPAPPEPGLKGLLSLARFTDQIWTVPAPSVSSRAVRTLTRGLGAPQEHVEHGFRLGSRVNLVIESEREGYLLLLDLGPEGIPYCLCPSRFAPETRLWPGRTYLPQPGSPHDSFVLTGEPGREHLLAILTEEPLGLDWMPDDPRLPARVLRPEEIALLVQRLRALPGDRWTALSSYFDVLP